jgi:polyhydroxyalkanoate depolymerase
VQGLCHGGIGNEEATMIYAAYQAHVDMTLPLRTLAGVTGATLREPPWRLAVGGGLRRIAAACEVMALAALTHRRPDFGVASVRIDGEDVPVHEEVACATPFATLVRFRKDLSVAQPRVLLVAPMSGHFATLLRDTVRTMLVDHDVYITDWHNARDVPLEAGAFGLDEYIEHVMKFVEVMGPGAHVVAICQPCVAALAATALMAEDGNPATPTSLTLMAGPIDCRVSPTAVNKLATSKPMEWFERHLIATVPSRYPGAMRRVYPGFVQLAAFMNMNLERHLNAFRGFYADLVEGNTEKASATRRFYEEYFAVADLPAEFYLETVRHVFQDYALALNRLKWRDRLVNPRAIRRTALVTIEGEKDDICSLGQTLAAQDLCARIPQFMRNHYIQAGAGHYGVFSGRRWNAKIYPIVRDMIEVSEQTRLSTRRRVAQAA